MTGRREKKKTEKKAWAVACSWTAARLFISETSGRPRSAALIGAAELAGAAVLVVAVREGQGRWPFVFQAGVQEGPAGRAGRSGL